MTTVVQKNEKKRKVSSIILTSCRSAAKRCCHLIYFYGPGFSWRVERLLNSILLETEAVRSVPEKVFQFEMYSWTGSLPHAAVLQINFIGLGLVFYIV